MTISGGHSDGSLRLSKRMSELGLASRREADEWIARGYAGEMAYLHRHVDRLHHDPALPVQDAKRMRQL